MLFRHKGSLALKGFRAAGWSFRLTETRLDDGRTAWVATGRRGTDCVRATGDTPELAWEAAYVEVRALTVPGWSGH